MLVNLKVRTCIILVLLLFTGAMFISNGVAWMGLNSSNDKLEQINTAYSDQAVPLNRAYTVFLRARLLLSTSLMDMQQGKTEQATAQAKRSDCLLYTSIGQLQVATFINPTGLQSVGENLYLETDASGPANLLQPGVDGAGTFMQNYVETSNVNVAEELVNMITTQRAYEMNSKAVKTSDEMLARLTQL